MLTKRLAEIVAALPQCARLADVGCDHGYVGLEALKRNVAERVIFVDISAASLQKARQNCAEHLISRAEFVCRNGLGDICADCAVIAGMGGLEIIAVLGNAEFLPQTVVLQPMRNQRDVRVWLSSAYEIVSDRTFFDGKFYDLIVAERNAKGCKLTEQQINFGKSNLENATPDFVAFLQKEQGKYKQILQQCNDAVATQRYAEINGILAGIMGVRK